LVHEETTPARNVPFPLKSSYAVNGDANGAVPVIEKNKELIKRIRREAKR
jgi:prefoldin subunit 5